MKNRENHFLSTNLYTSFGYCPYCKKSYHIRTHSSKEYGTRKFYGDSTNKSGRYCPNGFNIYFDVFKSAVSKTLDNLRKDLNVTIEILEKEMSTVSLENSLNSKIESINKEIAILDTKMKLYEQSSTEYYKTLLDRAKTHKMELLNNRIALENEKIVKCNSSYKVNEIITTIKNLPAIIDDTETIDFRKILSKAIMFEPDYLVFVIGDAGLDLVSKETPLFFEDDIKYLVHKTEHTLKFGITIK